MYFCMSNNLPHDVLTEGSKVVSDVAIRALMLSIQPNDQLVQGKQCSIINDHLPDSFQNH